MYDDVAEARFQYLEAVRARECLQDVFVLDVPPKRLHVMTHTVFAVVCRGYDNGNCLPFRTTEA